MIGKVITTSLGKAKQVEADIIWLITRGGSVITGVERHPELAPSPTLFSRYLNEWKGHEPCTWWPEYQRVFEAELQTKERQVGLRAVEELVRKGLIVSLACFCSDEEHCHRAIVGDHLRQRGIMVVEAPARKEHETETRNAPKQLSLFDMNE